MIYPWTSTVSILTKLLKTSTPLLYIFADDTSLNIIVEDPIHTSDQLNSDLAKLHRWAHKWLVSFNPGMSEYILLSRKYNKPGLLNQNQTAEVNSHKHLGVIFSNDST